MTNYLGELAGLLTSLMYTINATVVTRAGQQVGAAIVNRARVVFAFIYLLFINLILFGQPLPLSAGAERWGWLALSGVIGLALGDAFLFQSFLLVGPRIGSLLLALSTVFGILEAWLFFGETLALAQILGIALTLGGIIWVVIERQAGNESAHPRAAAGVTFGVLAALGQATGYVFSKQGLLGDFSPFQGNVIRMMAAALALWIMAGFQKQVGSTVQTLKQNPSALKLLALAAFIGPVLGVTSSLLAVQHAEVGVASVLTSLSPIFLLPVSRFILKERVGWQAIAGTLLAMAGVFTLFLA
ncbi:MAG: DMT family transporter [Chloroflexota bacterium]